MRTTRWRAATGAMALVSASLSSALFSAGAPGSGASAATVVPCTGDPSSPQLLSIGSGEQNGSWDGRYGYYALPSAQPVGVVAVGHGYQQTAASMLPVIEAIAARDDVVALAMDYTGTVDAGPGSTSSRGWRVTEGAADTIAATTLFDTSCRPAGGPALVNTLFGISMGGDTTGIAAAADARRGDGSALYSYWFDVSGVTDLTETYLEASLDAPVSAYASQATSDIQGETGGTPAQVPGAYVAASPVALAPQMKASGILGVDVCHAVLDGLVTSDEGDQMVASLQAAGIPVDDVTSVFQIPGDHSSTLDGDFLSLAVPGYQSPFAGHVNGIVLQTAEDRLAALYGHAVAPQGLSVTLSDGMLGTVPLLAVPGL